MTSTNDAVQLQSRRDAYIDATTRKRAIAENIADWLASTELPIPAVWIERYRTASQECAAARRDYDDFHPTTSIRRQPTCPNPGNR